MLHHRLGMHARIAVVEEHEVDVPGSRLGLHDGLQGDQLGIAYRRVRPVAQAVSVLSARLTIPVSPAA